MSTLQENMFQQHEKSNCFDENSKWLSPRSTLGTEDTFSGDYVDLTNKLYNTAMQHQISTISISYIDEKQQNAQNDRKLPLQNSSTSEQYLQKHGHNVVTEYDIQSFNSKCDVRKVKRKRTCAKLSILVIICSIFTGISAFLSYTIVKVGSKMEKSLKDFRPATFHLNVSQIENCRDAVPFLDSTTTSFITFDTNSNQFRVGASGTYELLLTLTLKRDNPQQTQTSLVCLRYSQKEVEFCKRFHIALHEVTSFDIIDIVQLAKGEEFIVTVNSLDNVYTNKYLNRLIVRYTD